jgi:thiosulfate reductase cytochrome b subunit
MKRIAKKHLLAIRWFHWINFPVLAMMIWSGLMIYWANGVYKLGFGDKTLLKFFPKGFYEALNLNQRLGEGMSYHFVFMWLFFINGLLYVLYTAFSGQWRWLLPDRHSLKEAWQTLLYDLRLRKTAPPQGKYNGAQKIAYSAIIVMGLGSVATGLAIYKPVQFGWLCTLCGGYTTARVIHFALTIGYCLFFVIHIAQVIRAGWNNFQSMVTGFDVLPPVVLPPVAEPTKDETPVLTDETPVS